MYEKVPPVFEGQILSNVLVQGRGKTGDGIVFIDGYPIFVDANPGEKLTIRIQKVGGRFGRASVEE